MADDLSAATTAAKVAVLAGRADDASFAFTLMRGTAKRLVASRRSLVIYRGTIQPVQRVPIEQPLGLMGDDVASVLVSWEARYRGRWLTGAAVVPDVRAMIDLAEALMVRQAELAFDTVDFRLVDVRELTGAIT